MKLNTSACTSNNLTHLSYEFTVCTNNNFVFIFKEQAIRSGGGKNYDSVSSNDRDGYGQPDGK